MTTSFGCLTGYTSVTGLRYSAVPVLSAFVVCVTTLSTSYHTLKILSFTHNSTFLTLHCIVYNRSLNVLCSTCININNVTALPGTLSTSPWRTHDPSSARLSVAKCRPPLGVQWPAESLGHSEWRSVSPGQITTDEGRHRHLMDRRACTSHVRLPGNSGRVLPRNQHSAGVEWGD